MIKRQLNLRVHVVRLMVLLVLLFGVTYLTVGALNPLTVFSTNNVLAKIAIAVFGVLAGLYLLQMLNVLLFLRSIAVTAHQNPWDVVCPGCGEPLLLMMGEKGQPIYCSNIHRKHYRGQHLWWHNGPECYNDGMPKKVISFPMYPCPQCRTEVAASEEDVFKDLTSSW